MAKLKVFRTPIGFHDAYVAAPSQKAALQAWGAEADLFARGLAEKVDDADLTREPLSKPGQVIRVRRGTDAQHFKALPERRANPARSGKKTEQPQAGAPTNRRQSARAEKARRSRPSRAAVDRAERAIAKIETSYRQALQAFAEKERALKDERKRLASDHDRALQKLTTARDAALAHYHRRVEEWAVGD
ncbi:hypothetical protein [Sphingobium nicotianae]|uniref:Cell envelope biogenesis protein TolA n=1 Tax=Sphingobium nicotianae TaxID=2782607 RepID=A0A9X1DB32_9SPHN|nr:hypothetical protein [Sphingobium nicotianae]MBT2186775.1 hypothetical protein [Sphingobium nicotianae]